MEPTRAQPSFDLENWVNFYYQNPSPEKVPEVINMLVQKKLLSECNPAQIFQGNQPFTPGALPYHPFIYMFTCLFKRHPERIWDWIKLHKSLPDKPFRGLIEAVWLSNTDAGREVLQKLQASLLKVAEFAEKLLARPRFDFENFVPSNPTGFDFLWTAFSFTGDTRYIAHLLDSVPVIEQNLEMDLRFKEIVFTSLILSMNSQVNEHPQIRGFVLQHCQTVPYRNHRVIREIFLTLNSRGAILKN